MSRNKLPKPKRDDWTRVSSVNKRIINDKKVCIICGEKKERKYYGKNNKGYDVWETLVRYDKRITCGNYKNDFGKWVRTDCYNKYITGSGNPNFKNLMPVCIDCGKRLNGYSSKKGIIPKRCGKCWKKYAKKNNILSDRTKERNLKGFGFQKGQKAVGKVFVKGHIAWNKGKTYEELFGDKKAKKLKENLAIIRRKKLF